MPYFWFWDLIVHQGKKSQRDKHENKNKPQYYVMKNRNCNFSNTEDWTSMACL